jgi:ribosomal protein L12E/L44/L45/RPP1/RPP2
MKTLLAAAFVLIAVPAAYAEDAKPSGATQQQQQQAADQSYQEEKAQEKALKEGKAWTK